MAGLMMIPQENIISARKNLSLF